MTKHPPTSFCVAALLDFSSPFNTIGHCVLVNSGLHVDFSFNDAVSKWFFSDLTHLKQCVCVWGVVLFQSPP